MSSQRSAHTEVLQPRFCAIEYQPRGARTSASHLLLWARLESDGELCLRVAPHLRRFVRRADMPYIQSLLEDLPERVRMQPQELFLQLSELAVGPLVAQFVGREPGDYATRCADFIELT